MVLSRNEFKQNIIEFINIQYNSMPKYPNTYCTITILLITLLITLTSEMSFQLTSYQPSCFTIQGGHNFQIGYVSSGVNPQLVQFIITQSGKQLARRQNLDSAGFGIDLPSGQVQLCFSTADSQPKKISVDFYPQMDPLHQVIDKKQITIVKNSLVKSISDLMEIVRNQQFHLERDQTHKKILEKSEKRIKWAGVIKIAFLLISALAQLWIMKGFFKNANPYQPVNM